MKKILLLIAALLPILSAIVAGIMLVSEETMIIGVVAFIFACLMACIDMILFIVVICLNKSLTVTQKVIWCICAWLLNILLFPIYWFVHIRTE